MFPRILILVLIQFQYIFFLIITNYTYIYEVKNTFGDIHHYITNNKISKNKFHKKMFVSPFLRMMDTMKFYPKLETSQFL